MAASEKLKRLDSQMRAPQAARPMARMVNCVVLKREAPGLTYMPYPGELGKRIYESVSQEGWTRWVAHQTTLINEYRLTPIEPKARKFLQAEMEQFFFGTGSDKPTDFKAI
jgi:Fe-S cluster biosynthesis and repair protein YggX